MLLSLMIKDGDEESIFNEFENIIESAATMQIKIQHLRVIAFKFQIKS